LARDAERKKLAPLKTWLIDTGPLVAYLDASEPSHDCVSQSLDGFSGPLATSGAVITEAMHFLGDVRGGAAALAELVRRSGMRVYDVCQPADLKEAAALMDRYADTPMDFADATLVLLARALATKDVLTLDRRGFYTYRTADGKAFKLVLEA
jgi:predicted nucleic acid-binding protein